MALHGTQRRTIAISGGGIAGLTAALALQAKGFRAIVLERHEEMPHQGAGIQISPNALHILDRLGVGRRVREAATAPEAIIIRDAYSGDELTRFVLGERFTKRHGLPYLVIHRADLLQALLVECKNGSDIDIRMGSQVRDCAPHSNGVTLLAERAGEMQELPAAALVGADGAWSTTRSFVESARAPKATGYVAWRALIPMDRVPAGVDRSNTGLWLSPKAHLVHYPIRQGQFLNIICVLRQKPVGQPNRGWMKGQTDTPPLDVPKGWNDDLQNLLSQTMMWGGWPLNAAQRVTSMGQGPIALMGDAAHAMVPFAAQGGACAIEDAAVLAQCFAQSADDLPRGVAAYSTARVKRANKVCDLARKNGRIYHLQGSLAQARNFVMGRMSQERLQKRMDWLYGWRESNS
ncbi:FAD-dependent monooxygenase [Pseudahrensia aquimaris]|uniref:FAD-dependent monooxygenase n=1 Tax=Pseudahrensia aquimaris TaxID=744461 RepID=A0ABW3FAU0_9HYPH